MIDPRPILIAGPTASGKSSLALSLALMERSLVINADALQVYACWRVLTARPSPEEEAQAPHRLYGHVAADVNYSVGSWLRDLAAILDEIRGSNTRPIIVGGTGLYLTALTSGLADIPPVPAHIRQASERMIKDGKIDELLTDLSKHDPDILRSIDKQNPVRIMRAWEVLHGTGKPLSEWQSQPSKPLIALEDCIPVCLVPDKGILNRNIAERFANMADSGAIEECRAYLDAGLPGQSLPSSKALGAQQLFAYIQGQSTLDAAIEGAVIETRQFAKRQRTWFRSKMKNWMQASDKQSGIDLISGLTSRSRDRN